MLVVAVVLAVVTTVVEAGNGDGRASKGQDGELGVDRRHLFESDDEKDRKTFKIFCCELEERKKVLLLERLEQKPTRA